VWLELVAYQHLGVGSGRIGAPNNISLVFVQRGDPAAHAHLAAAVPDQNFSFHNHRRHGDGLPLIDLAELGVPEFLPGICIHRDRVVVERVEEYLAVVVSKPARDNVAAGDALRRKISLRGV
jgi:hypothetical protein